MATYVNNLRLTELATGEGSGTWGTTTNTNLELIGEALGYGSEAIANASTHTITVADGTADSARSFYLKLTGGGQACTVTLAPNTLSKVWMVENTTNSTLTFSQGSGANVAVPAGQVKMIATDGAGSGAVVYDLLVDTDLTGTTTVVNLTSSGTIDAATVEFNSLSGTGSVAITDILDQDDMSSNSATALATQQSIKAYVDSSVASFDTLAEVLAQGNTTGGTDIVMSAGDNITNASGNMSIDVAGDLTLDAGGANINFNDDGTAVGHIEMAGQNLEIKSKVADKNIILKGNDGGSEITALTLSMANAGAATFNGDVTLGAKQLSLLGSLGTWSVDNQGAVMNFSRASASYIRAGSSGGYLVLQTNGANAALTLDGSQNATVAGNLTVQGADVTITGNVIHAGDTNTYFGFHDADQWRVVTGGTERIEVTNTEIVINDSSVDMDFRVESDTNANMLLVNGGNNSVSIGTSTSEATFTVGGSATFNADSADADFRVESDVDTHALFINAENSRLGLSQGNPSYSVHVGDGGAAQRVHLEGNGGGALFSGVDSANNSNFGFRWGHLNGTDRLEGAIGTTQIIDWRNTALYFKPNATEVLALTSSEVTVNNGSADVDFRVESNGNTYMLFVDGGNNRVGVGMSAPLEPLHTTGRILSTTTYGGSTQRIGTSIGQNGSTRADIDFRRWTGASTNHGVGMIEVADTGIMRFYVDSKTSNTPATTERISLAPSGAFTTTPTTAGHAVFNGNGVDADFQVLSDGNTHMLFVDGGNNRVGIGKSTPSFPLDVANPDAAETTITAVFRAGSDADNNRSNIFIGQQNNSRGLLIQGGRETGDRAIAEFILNGSGGTLGSNIINFLQAYEVQGSSEFEVTINQDGENVDFRVESDSNAHMLFVDAGNNKIILGGSSQDAAGTLTYVSGTGLIRHTTSAGTAKDHILYSISGVNNGFQTTVDTSNNITYKFHVGGNAEAVRFGTTESVFNENSVDRDFRVESNTKNEMLLVDGGNDIVNFNSTQTTHQMGAAWRPDGKLRDFQRDVASATFNESSNVNTPSRTRRLIIPLHNYGPVKITIMNGGHLYNNGGSFGFRETTFYVAMESSSMRVNEKVDGVNAGSAASSYGVPTASAHSSTPELKIEWTVAAQMTCSTHVKVEGYGANGIASIGNV